MTWDPKPVTIGVRYSCECGINDVEVQVKARTDEDVTEWVEKVMADALSRDHDKRSPHCHPKGLKDVKIPMAGADRVGGAPRQ